MDVVPQTELRPKIYHCSFFFYYSMFKKKTLASAQIVCKKPPEVLFKYEINRTRKI